MEAEMKYGYSEWIWSEKEILDRKGVISWHAKKYSPNEQILEQHLIEGGTHCQY